MKHLIKAVTFVSFMLMVGAASAASLQDLQVRELDKIAVSSVTFSTSVFMNITYTGASTQCVVVIGSGAFTTRLPGPDATDDLNYNLEATAYDTMGELCDAINSADSYACTLIGAKRNDLSILTKNVTASTSQDAKLVAGYDVLIDTGGILSANPPYIVRLGITPRSGKRVVLHYCIGNINVADTLFVSGKLAKYDGVSDGIVRNDNSIVYSAITADDTDKTIGSIYGVNWLEFAKNEHVVIGNGGGTGVQQSANLIECVWDEK